MIIDHISNAMAYAALGKNFETALKFMADLDPSALKVGRNEVDGDRVFANYVDRELKDIPNVWEFHAKYADIHFVLEGSEALGYYPITRLAEVPAIDPEGDCALLKDLDGVLHTLEPGEFMIALPQDIHMPNHPGKNAGYSKKVIMKVLVDEA